MIDTERNRRSGRQHSVSTRRMVALYDYDPRESSPNVDVEVKYYFMYKPDRAIIPNPASQ